MTQGTRDVVALSCLAVMMMAAWETVSGQNVVYSDQEAGTLLNTLSPRGIGLSVKWHSFRFKQKMDAIMATMGEAEAKLDEYEADGLPNITAIAEEKLADLMSMLDAAEALAESKGLNNTDDDLVAFMKSPQVLVNAGYHYDLLNSVFRVPKAGLYQVLVRSMPYDSSFSCTVSRNGNETLVNLDHDGFFDMRTRVKLVMLNAGDEIFTTNDDPSYFQVLHLRQQTLMPDSLASVNDDPPTTSPHTTSPSPSTMATDALSFLV